MYFAIHQCLDLFSLGLVNRVKCLFFCRFFKLAVVFFDRLSIFFFRLHNFEFLNLALRVLGLIMNSANGARLMHTRGSQFTEKKGISEVKYYGFHISY